MYNFENNIPVVTKFDEDFILLEVIGSGTTGIVYKAKKVSSDQMVAIKRLRIRLTEEGLPFSVIREVSLLRFLSKYNHENIVKLMGVELGSRTSGEQQINLIFEFMDKDLHLFLTERKSDPLPFQRSLNLMRQLLLGINFLHSKRIIHRDIKPQNILLNADGQILKLTDFGLARLNSCSVKLTSVVVTVWYRAPEIILRVPHYDESIDIWSAGCVSAEIFLRSPLFCGDSEIDTLNRILDICGMPNESEWPLDAVFSYSSCYSSNCSVTLSKYLEQIANIELQETIKNMLEFNPIRRLRTAEILNKACFSTGNHSNNLTISYDTHVLTEKQKENTPQSPGIVTSDTSVTSSRFFAKPLENNEELLIHRQMTTPVDVITLSSDSSPDNADDNSKD